VLAAEFEVLPSNLIYSPWNVTASRLR